MGTVLRVQPSGPAGPARSAVPGAVARTPVVLPDRRVLKAGAVRTVASAAVTQAAAEAAAAHADELARVAEAARAEGYRTGVEETLAAGAAAAERGAAALEALVETVRAQDDRELAATHATVVAVAVEVAEWVLRRELGDGGRSLLARLELGLTALLPSPTTRIAVAPDDHAVVAEWAAGRGRLGTTVLADQRLAPGDAVVTTDAGSAEVTVAAALRAAAETLGLSVAQDESADDEGGRA